MALSYMSDKSKKPDQQAQSAPTPTPAPNGQRSMLAGYWGDQWRTPQPEVSQMILVCSVALAALLVAIRNLAAAASWKATIALFVAEVTCFLVEIGLMAGHDILIEQYHARFQRHKPARVGSLVAATMFIFRTLVLQYDIDMTVLMCDLHVWFWGGYWVEWWTGVSMSVGGDLGVF
ncbi:hypothetical protein PG997_000426 [Apiospora hydei]|uniref:Uncharacterized protein n=1 Tax=Apiospora hydei TaxID=1337664 RepID=A0ABR1XAK4_9PEZI